ncbi:fumarylacetoacetate hydrolase family protein [Microbispora sp. NPDC046933]|uniref:fumarylacetoacetate hydrolase family protein n=1 Tax=Microbispora sp. NPDC046933 TaxID=3155618 RepID=UPI00340D9C34
MRIATFEADGAERAGLVSEDQVRPLPAEVTVRGLLERDALPGAADLAGPPIPLDSVRLLPPLHPASIRDFVGFEAHIEGAARAQEGKDAVPSRWYEAPAFYFTNPHACVGSGAPVPIFPGSERFDLECEVAVVIGKAGRDLTPEQAREHIAGYTIFNDWSARDVQQLEGRLPFGFAKGKDGAHTLGPWLVTPDELEPYRTADGYLDLTMTAEINGVVLGEDSLANCSWTFEEQISYASRGAWIRPGDVLASGTHGGGCLAEIWGRAGRREPRPLAPGDVVTLTVEGIGTVTNTVVEPGPATPIPTARRRGRGPTH